MSQVNCPRATVDVIFNTMNRDAAIASPVVAYGPANPSLKNERFWKKKAALWGVSVPTAQSMRCGNCKAFNVSPFVKACMGSLGSAPDTFDELSGQFVTLGYCEAHRFKCASSRTCNTWLHGGPTV